MSGADDLIEEVKNGLDPVHVSAAKAAMSFEAVKMYLKQTKDGTVIHFVADTKSVPADIQMAMVGTRYLLALVELGDDELPVPPAIDRAGFDAVKAAGALARNPTFIAWLSQKFPDFSFASEEEVAEWLRFEIGITSRSELKTSSRARDAFYKIREEFITDYRSGRV